MKNELRECPFCGNLHVLLRNIEYDKTLWIIEVYGQKRDSREKERQQKPRN